VPLAVRTEDLENMRMIWRPSINPEQLNKYLNIISQKFKILEAETY